MADNHPETHDGLPRSELAYRRLLEALLDGRLKPGQRVRETQLAEQFGISRTPVREALRRLQNEGLLTTEPYRGMTVARLDQQAVMELYLMREVLEGTAAGLAARHAADAEIDLLEDILAEERQAGEDPERRATLNRRFHGTIYHAAHNRYLLRSLNALRDSMAILGATTYKVEGRAAKALAEHQTILAAIRARDPQSAEQAARRHIRAAQRARLQILESDTPKADHHARGIA
jgi:DNA-binding GntR family transcriptional regulator